MPKAKLVNMAGQQIGEYELSEAVFGIEPNGPVLHASVVNYLANQRQGTQSALTKGEVSYTTKKPWRQKGTGRARAGSIRSPLWRGGGVTFAARPQDHSQKVNRKMYRVALQSIFSELLRQDRLVVVNDFSVEQPKTKELVKKLKDMQLSDVLIIKKDVDANLFLSARNLYKVDVRDVKGIDPVSLIRFDKVLITADAVKEVEESLKL